MKITEGYLDGALEQIELAHFDLLEYLICFAGLLKL